MRRLFIDSSSDYLSLLISSDSKALSYTKILAGRQISEMIVHQLDQMLKAGRLKIGDIDEYYAIIGPGSFTGVRIGVAVALGLSAGSQCQSFGITSLDCAAVVSGRQKAVIVSRLKDDIFASRRYDFQSNSFSDIETYDINEFKGEDIITVNSSEDDSLDISKLICDERYLFFRQQCEPIYLRKAEAEINLEKIGQ